MNKFSWRGAQCVANGVACTNRVITKRFLHRYYEYLTRARHSQKTFGKCYVIRSSGGVGGALDCGKNKKGLSVVE